jgi:hypothetical protein
METNQNAEMSANSLAEMLRSIESEPKSSAYATTTVSSSMPTMSSNAGNSQLQEPVKQTIQSLQGYLSDAQEIDPETRRLMLENRTLLRQLFPNKTDKLIDQMKHNMIRSSSEFRLNLYKLNADFWLDNAREHMNSAMKMTKAEYRERVSAFMMLKLEQLAREVKTRQFNFIEMAKEKMDYARSLSGYPDIQRGYLMIIQTEQQEYLEFLQRLIRQFQSIVDEEIKNYRIG